jgi:hypothetical protein
MKKRDRRGNWDLCVGRLPDPVCLNPDLDHSFGINGVKNPFFTVALSGSQP